MLIAIIFAIIIITISNGLTVTTTKSLAMQLITSVGADTA
jgi:hypothetical protein